jgi:SHS2 domain-containing protein
MKQFVFFEHAGDAKFQAFGKTIEECFENSALAMNSVECNTKKVAAKKKLSIEASAQNQEELLHKFLEEILFQMETKQMLFSKFKIKISKEQTLLKAELFGEKIDKKKHELKTLVKAVTWNNFYLKKQGKTWEAQVVCDT